MDLDSILDDIEVDIGLSQVDIKSNKVTTSTGLLALDLILSGGMVTGGWYTMFGGEQSCKSTLVMTQMARAVDMPIPYLIYADYEGSFSSEYFLNIAKHVGVIDNKMSEDAALHKIFGLKDDKDKWVIAPRVRYYPMSIGEKFFDLVARLQRALPDKLFKNGKWWLVYDNTKENKKLVKEQKLAYDEKLLKSTEKFWVETDNGFPQALIAVDSYPAMHPGKLDVDDPSGGLGSQARMFADNLRRIKGKMSAKRITIMGVNQLRLRPMVTYGCLHADTRIPFVDGSSHTIQDIVNGELTGQVWSLNLETQKLEPKDIVGWHFNGDIEKQSDWIKITTINTMASSGLCSVAVTPEHKIFTDLGWIEAKNLSLNNKVLSTKNTGTEVIEEYTSISKIEVGNDKLFRQKGKFDLSISDNTNYIAGGKDCGFIVKNSPEYEPGGEALKFNCFTSDTIVTILDSDNFIKNVTAENLIDRNLDYQVRTTIGFEKPNIFSSLGEKNCISLTLDDTIFTGAEEHRLRAFNSTHTCTWTSLKTMKDSNQSWLVERVIMIEGLINFNFYTVKPEDFKDVGIQKVYDFNFDSGTVITNSLTSHNSDVRIRMASRSVQGGSGQLEEEDGIHGGTDQYRYIHMRAHKNKLSVPNLECWARVWARDAEGVAHGFDPVYDCFWLCKEIGILTGTKNRLKFNLPRMQGHKGMTWLQLKLLVLGDRTEIKNTMAALGIDKPFLLREELFKLVASGKALELFFAKKKGDAEKEVKEVEEVED